MVRDLEKQLRTLPSADPMDPGYRSRNRRDGRWQPDPLVLDEQALIVNVRDRGLVVITGCGHAGVVNIARYARRGCWCPRMHRLARPACHVGPVSRRLRAERGRHQLRAVMPGPPLPAELRGVRLVHEVVGDAAVDACACVERGLRGRQDIDLPGRGQETARLALP